MTTECPDTEYHGNPFRYCSCGWMEAIPEDPDQFLKKAKALVVDNFKRATDQLSVEEVYIVWFAKTLGNWKALLSSNKFHGIYWEVTYDGTKCEAYIDTYSKIGNKAVPDND